MTHRSVFVRAALAAALVAASSSTAIAQSYVAPAFQPPRTTTREYNFALAGADDAGTVLMAQWREGMSPRGQLMGEVGFADAENASGLFFGGNYAHQLATSTAAMPLDFLLTMGVGFLSINPEAEGADNLTVFRVPVGVSIGRRFPLEGAMSLTPYLHPRFVFENCGDCGDETDLGLEFDFGADFIFTPTMSIRFNARMGGPETFIEDSDAFGVSIAWTPGRTR